MLEAALYTDNAFVTLTYETPKLPTLPSGQPVLVPSHLQNFVKRLRKSIEPTRIRFYAVGEYGDANQRPHFHLALFNFPPCLRGRTLRWPGTSRPNWNACCPHCNLVGRTWGFGDIDIGNLETNSAQYVAGYVTKKMTSKDDPRLAGRHPEFARMSNRPGIGADALHEIASQLLTFNLDTSQADVPSALRHGSRTLPLGRYLRRKLRTLVGKDEKAPPEVLAQMAASVHLLLENYERRSLVPGQAQENLTSRIIQAGSQKVLQIEGRERIFKKRESI